MASVTSVVATSLGPLPGDTSKQFHLNQIDWLKILRIFLIQVGGIFLTEVPKLVGMNYVWKGVDYTPYVILIVNCLAEMVRRWLTGQKADGGVG